MDGLIETPAQRYRRLHPKQANANSRRWRKKNKEAMALLNRRNKVTRQICYDWIREHRSDVLEAAKKEAKKLVPIADLAIECIGS